MLRKQCRTLVQIANLELRYVLVILPVNWPARRNEFLPRGYVLGLVLVCMPLHFSRDHIGTREMPVAVWQYRLALTVRPYILKVVLANNC